MRHAKKLYVKYVCNVDMQVKQDVCIDQGSGIECMYSMYTESSLKTA